MKLSELISRFRIESHDTVEPYFVSDEAVTMWLNDAQDEAVIRGRLLYEFQDTDLCNIPVTAGTAYYPLDSRLYELVFVCLNRDQCKPDHLYNATPEYLNGRLPDWRQRKGRPEYFIQDDKGIRLVPMPIADSEIIIEAYRLPMEAMEDPDDEPEIHKANHAYLVQWALHKAFSVPDSEFFDKDRAFVALETFNKVFGLRPDRDLRRSTRTDEVQRTEVFFP